MSDSLVWELSEGSNEKETLSLDLPHPVWRPIAGNYFW